MKHGAFCLGQIQLPSHRIGSSFSLVAWTGKRQNADMRRKTANLFIVIMLAIMLLDGMPSAGVMHDRAKQWIDPWLDASGLWQGHWALFAPDVLKRNARVSAELEDTNGISLHWQSPRFQELSIFERFRAFREGEFFDNIRNNDFTGARDSVASYLARTEFPADVAGHKLMRVRLRRHWWDIPAPGQQMPPPDEQWHQFYVKEFQP